MRYGRLKGRNLFCMPIAPPLASRWSHRPAPIGAVYSVRAKLSVSICMSNIKRCQIQKCWHMDRRIDNVFWCVLCVHTAWNIYCIYIYIYRTALSLCNHRDHPWSLLKGNLYATSQELIFFQGPAATAFRSLNRLSTLSAIPNRASHHCGPQISPPPNWRQSCSARRRTGIPNQEHVPILAHGWRERFWWCGRVNYTRATPDWSNLCP